MFITTIRKDIDIKNLMAGHDYNIDSGMGGSYTVRYNGKKQVKGNTIHLFDRIYKKGMEPFPPFTYEIKESELEKKIYALIPEEIYYRKGFEEKRKDIGILPDHDERCLACRMTGKVFVEFIGPEGNTATIVYNAVNKAIVNVYTPCRFAPMNSDRRKIPYVTCMEIDKFVDFPIGWQLTEDQNKWVCPEKHYVIAESALKAIGYKPHGEQAVWLETGKWTE